MATVPQWQKVTAIPGMLIFGTCTVVTQKFLFEQTSTGKAIYGDSHKFEKPWFQTAAMFVGMFLSLIVYEITRIMHKSEKDQDQESIVSEPENDKSKPSHLKMYFVVAAPACCDLLATSLMNIGLLSINASVWQMLRGSMVLFSSIFCAFILKRPHFPYMWWSVLLVTIALLIVGFSSVIATGVGKAGVSTTQVIVAICLTVGSQVIQAAQIVVEDFLLHDISASPFLIVGLEGMWGTLFTLSIFWPITQCAFPNMEEGNGIHEDWIDSFKMIGNSTVLMVFVILYIIFILAYNVTGMFVTNITSAVVRTILEGLRTLCIWVVQLIIYYSTCNTTYGHHHPDLGEEWNIYSWMELGGFALLFTGMLTYNAILKFPFFFYPGANQINNTPLLEKEDK